MANYESNQGVTQLKVLFRANPLPVDSTEIWESLSEAQTYAKAANAYGGQTIKAKLEDGKYHQYILQPSDAGYTLEEVGSSNSTKQYVIVGTRPDSNQEQGIIYIDNNVGYIWSGSSWTRIFSDVSTDISEIEERLDTIESDLTEKAPLSNPAFTGDVTIEGSQVATQEYVNTLIGQINNGVPGIVDGSDNPLPSTGYKAGQMWRVAADGDYVGTKCEIGDLIICLKSYTAETAGNTDFMVLQANIDGAVTGAESSTDGHIVIFNGTTGKIIKDSNVTISSLNDAISKSHTHANKTQLDTFTKTEEELLSSAHDDAASQISTAKTALEESISQKANVSDVYTKSDIDDKLSTITNNLNTKVDATTVDSKISQATEDILESASDSAQSMIDEKIGDLGESDTVVDFVNKAVGSGGTDVAGQIDDALAQAKAYTDSALTITEF